MKARVIVYDIRSVHNVGSIFRTADTMGIEKIYLSENSPAPLDRFDRVRKDFIKVSLGAEKTVQWEGYRNISKLIKELKKEKFTIIAIEQSKHSVDYKKIKAKGNICFVLGNEVSGIPLKILKQCDVVAEIPMKGKKESLNVSVAFGVAAFRILDY